MGIERPRDSADHVLKSCHEIINITHFSDYFLQRHFKYLLLTSQLYLGIFLGSTIFFFSGLLSDVPDPDSFISETLALLPKWNIASTRKTPFVLQKAVNLWTLNLTNLDKNRLKNASVFVFMQT